VKKKPSKRQKDVVKANALVEACYRPKSLGQMRLLLAALTQVKATEKLDHETDFVVTAGALSDLTGAQLQASYKALYRAAKELMETHITVERRPNGEAGKPIKEMINVVSSCQYDANKGQVTLNFTPSIVPYISELSSHFTAYKTQFLMKLRSAYGIRLYELCLQWIPFGPEREIAVEDFRKIFKLEDRHKNIYALKRYVIYPAIKDVNQYTDLNVTLGQRKAGRVITHLQFVIEKKKPPSQEERRKLVYERRMAAAIAESRKQLAEVAERRGLPVMAPAKLKPLAAQTPDGEPAKPPKRPG